MTTKPKIFNAVAESRKWREETSGMLDAMDGPARLRFLAGLRGKLSPPRAGSGDTPPLAAVREDAPPDGPPGKEETP